VAVLDVIFAVILLVLVYRVLRRPPNPKRTADAIDRVGKVASSPAVAVLGAGAALANPGAFIPIALKNISELDPSATQYIVDWLFFSLVSLLPLLVAIVLLLVARDWATRLLESVRGWLERNARTVAAVIVVLLAVSLLRNGIAGLTG
jgi:threonine/homoserine/homoserine lactone efflux protein